MDMIAFGLFKHVACVVNERFKVKLFTDIRTMKSQTIQLTEFLSSQKSNLVANKIKALNLPDLHCELMQLTLGHIAKLMKIFFGLTKICL